MTQGFVNPYTYAVSAPTVTTYTSGSGTYTVPSGVQFLVVEMCGGGGGGGGAGTGFGNGGTGGTSTFGSWTTIGGNGGTGNNTPSAPVIGGTGGSGGASGAGTQVLRVAGGSGGYGVGYGLGGITYQPNGGGSRLAGGACQFAGSADVAGLAGLANGGGGGGGAAASNNSAAGSGGGAEQVQFIISSPAATYSYAVGAGGTAGAGTGAGGAGGSGVIIIYEYYQTLGIPTTLTLPLPVNQGGTGVANDNWTAGSLTFSPSTQGIVGTTTNDNASAGYAGEIAESSATVNLTSNVYTDITLITLTAGDWDVYGNMLYASSANTTTLFGGWTTQTSASYPGNSFSAILSFSSGTPMNSGQAFAVPYRRYSLSATTTIYLTGVAIFSSGTGSVEGRIYARRAR